MGSVGHEARSEREDGKARVAQTSSEADVDFERRAELS
jgi:hypothetical protein